MERISKENLRKSHDKDESVLEKLLQINPDYAIIMAIDMLLVGIDTVGKVNFPSKKLITNFKLDRLRQLWLICYII